MVQVRRHEGTCENSLESGLLLPGYSEGRIEAIRSLIVEKIDELLTAVGDVNVVGTDLAEMSGS